MAEVLTLTTPVTAPSITTYKVVRLVFDWEGERIEIGLRGSDGSEKRHTYHAAVANTLMVQLNKVNLSTISLQRRVLERLATDGIIPGAVSGTPD